MLTTSYKAIKAKLKKALLSYKVKSIVVVKVTKKKALLS